MVGVGSVVRGRGGAGSAAGAGEVDGAVGGVLCLHLRPAPDLHAVSALPVRISLRDAVRLILKNINSVYFFNVFFKIISILQCPVSSSLITYQVNRRIYPSHHASSFILLHVNNVLVNGEKRSWMVIMCHVHVCYKIPQLHMFCYW